MDLKLKNKRVAVQGASSGLGFAIAKAFAEEGAQVAICSSDEGRVKDAARRMGAHPFAIDLDQPNAGRDFIQQTVSALGGIDILVTNTGGPPKGLFSELNAVDWEKGFRRLWLSASDSIHEALPHMKRQRFGRIILNTSTAAKEPIDGLTVSNGLRAGLLGLMKSLSREVAADGITVNAILPGSTRTKRLEELGKSEKQLVADIPMGRIGEPEELAALALFLASGPASYITGQAIACDGGATHSL